MKLYNYPPSQNCYKVRLLISNLGIQENIEIVNVSLFQGESHTEEFYAKNPSGAVPVLEIDTSEYLPESNAILFYLAQGTQFLPNDPLLQSHVVRWLCFEQDYVQSTIATLRYWNLTGKNDFFAEQIEQRKAGAHKTLGALNRQLLSIPFLLGEEYTIADISVYAYVHLSEEANLDLSKYPNVVAWFKRIKSQKGYDRKIHYYDEDPNSEKHL